MFGMQWWKEQLFEVVELVDLVISPQKADFPLFGVKIRMAFHPTRVVFRDLG